jgi:hypothetical protein
MQGYERHMEEAPEQTRSESLLHCKSSFVLNLNDRTQNQHKVQNEKEELAWAKKSLKLTAETTFFVNTSLTPWSQSTGGRLQIFWDLLRCKRLRRSHYGKCWLIGHEIF